MLATALALSSMLFAATLLAQTTPTAQSETIIPPVVWELAEMTEPNNGLVIDESGRYTVQFQSQDTVTVSAGCTLVAGTYTARNGVLDLTLSVATRAHCPSDSPSESFLELLDGATRFELDPDGCLILSGEKGRLRLRPTLAGVVWEWQEFRGGDDSFIAPSRPEDYTLAFMPEGNLAIRAGCARTIGAYTVDGPIIELSFQGATRAECRPGPLAQRFLQDLSDVSSHVFRDGSLYLALRADAGIMAFSARYDVPPRATPAAG